MFTKVKFGSVLGGSVLILLIVWMGFFSAASAQDEPDQTPTPPRGPQGEAPEREPIILQEPSVTSSPSTILQIPAAADAYIASAKPNQNFGTDALFLGYNLNEFGAERILIRFNLDTIPDNANIRSAQLRLYQTFSSPSDDDPMGTVLRRLASPWEEETVTWNTEPTWTEIDDTTFIDAESGWYEWEVGDVVEFWLANNQAENYGIEIIGDETVQQRERAFYSRETTTDRFPQLIVDYTTFDDTEPPNITVDPLPDFVGRNFTVSWSGDDPGEAEIDYYDVQYRVDGGNWIDWLTETEETEAEFSMGENGRFTSSVPEVLMKPATQRSLAIQKQKQPSIVCPLLRSSFPFQRESPAVPALM